jgi:GNAT superfamily N-acetyltransferase
LKDLSHIDQRSDIVSDAATDPAELQFLDLRSEADFPVWAPRTDVARFFHETMEPYNDELADVERALDYALVDGKGQGGFVTLAHRDHQLLGALCMLDTGMSGYIPEHILLFVSVSPDARGQGLGGRLIEHCLGLCDGDVKLHVEYDNPAKRLYERLGFESKYAEMRWTRGERS